VHSLARRFVIALAVALMLMLLTAGSAAAWTWPAGGDLLRPFVLGDDPYAGGQHRGIDVGGAEGEAVVAPATGTVTYVGTVPTHGRTITITTADGYAITLTHLGDASVSKGSSVTEGERIASVGSSGTPEHAGPYLHLGIRTASEEQGYLDPLRFLPSRPTASQPAPAAPAVAAPAPTPAPTQTSAPPPTVPPTPVPTSTPTAAATSTPAPISTPAPVSTPGPISTPVPISTAVASVPSKPPAAPVAPHPVAATPPVAGSGAATAAPQPVRAAATTTPAPGVAGEVTAPAVAPPASAPAPAVPATASIQAPPVATSASSASTAVSDPSPGESSAAGAPAAAPDGVELVPAPGSVTAPDVSSAVAESAARAGSAMTAEAAGERRTRSTNLASLRGASPGRPAATSTVAVPSRSDRTIRVTRESVLSSTVHSSNETPSQTTPGDSHRANGAARISTHEASAMTTDREVPTQPGTLAIEHARGKTTNATPSAVGATSGLGSLGLAALLVGFGVALAVGMLVARATSGVRRIVHHGRATYSIVDSQAATAAGVAA